MDCQLEKNDLIDEELGKLEDKSSSRSSDNVPNEKEPYADVEIHKTDFDIGNVFESGPRLIDLGKDGKERPIRAYSFP